MSDDAIPLHAVPILEALGRSHGAISFAELKEATGLAQATLNRTLNTLCDFRYALKVGHGKYMAGSKLVGLGKAICRNQIVTGFQTLLCNMTEATQLNAELYLITPGGPVFFSCFHAPREANVPFNFGHTVHNREHHPAGLFYVAIHEGLKVEGYRENFIVDRGGQWPELFRAAALIPGTSYCLALSGMLTNVDAERHEELKKVLHEFPKTFELPGQLNVEDNDH